MPDELRKEGIHPLISALILIVVAVAASALFVLFIYPMIVGLGVIKDFTFTAEVYSDGTLTVRLKNMGTISIKDASVAVAGAAITVTWTPPIPVKPGTEAIGSGTVPAVPAGTPIPITVEVTFADETKLKKSAMVYVIPA